MANKRTVGRPQDLADVAELEKLDEEEAQDSETVAENAGTVVVRGRAPSFRGPVDAGG